MIKKIAIGLAVAAFLAAVGLGYFTLKSRSVPQRVDVFKAVPQDALFIMRVNKAEHVMHALSCLEANESEAVFTILNKHWLSKDSTLNTKMPSYLVVSSHPTDSADRSGMIYYVVFPKEDLRQDFSQRLLSGKTPAYVRSNSVNSGELIFEDSTRLHFRQLRHIVMLSTSEKLVVSAAAQWDKEESLVQNKQLASALETAGRNATLNLFINGDLLSAISSNPFTKKTDRGLLDVFSFSSSTGWMALDVEIRAKLSNLTGFWAGTGMATPANPLFSSVTAEAEYFQHLPYNSAYVQGASFSNLDSVLIYYESFLQEKGIQTSYLQDIAAMSDSLNVNIRNFITELLPQEIAIAYVPTSGGGEWITLLKVASTDIALAQLRTLSREGDLNPIKGAIGLLYGGVFKNNNEAYFAFTDGYLMLSSSRRLLEEAKANKKNFGQAMSDLKSEPYILNNSSTFTYQNLQNFGNKVLTIGKFNLQSRLTFQLALVNNALYCNIVTPVRPNPDWSTEVIDDEPDHSEASVNDEEKTPQRVQLFRKSVSEGKKRFILEQDKDFSLTITQLDGGTIVVPTDGVIRNAEICEMTGKSSYNWVFNTDSLIYMVTPEGTAAKGFPITLPAKATNGITVFDYGNMRDYRIFVACADKKVRLYDKSGKPVDGWAARQTESVVTEPVVFFRLENKDYIVFSDEDNVYILHRKGEDRVKPKEKIARAKGSELKGLVNPPRITCEDTEGRIVVIYLSDGRVERK